MKIEFDNRIKPTDLVMIEERNHPSLIITYGDYLVGKKLIHAFERLQEYNGFLMEA